MDSDWSIVHGCCHVVVVDWGSCYTRYYCRNVWMEWMTKVIEVMIWWIIPSWMMNRNDFVVVVVGSHY